MYVSAATFIPQGSDAGTSGIALAASQLGLRVPSTGSSWGPPIYVELLRSRALLESIALDTITVSEEKGRRITVMELVRADAPTQAQRLDLAVRALSGFVTATEDKKIGAVRLTVTTKWPSVSLWLADRLLRGVNEFNLKTRKSQATAERQFVESRAGEAELALKSAEDRLQSHVQQNRVIANSPELVLQRDRLQREVQLRQQVFTSLLMNREEAKIREVRDTPVITVLQAPGLPVVGEARKSAQKGVLGGMVGGILAVVIAFIARGLTEAQREPSEDARELLRTLEDATPGFLRRRFRQRTS
jgi:hypothetical protein